MSEQKKNVPNWIDMHLAIMEAGVRHKRGVSKDDCVFLNTLHLTPEQSTKLKRLTESQK